MKTYLTRIQALKTYPITEAELEDLLTNGLETAWLLADDTRQQIFYDDDLAAYVAERDITPEQFEHLQGILLNLNQAGLTYKISSSTIHGWVKQGLLKIQAKTGNQNLVNEADVAYLATLAHAKKMRSGKRLFNF